jgi:hypothetical protein
LYNSVIFPWVVSHLSLIGWPTLIFTCYKLLRFIFKSGTLLTVFIQRVLKAEDTIHLMATNHLPHLEMYMQDTNKSVQEGNKTLDDIHDTLKLLLVRGAD